MADRQQPAVRVTMPRYRDDGGGGSEGPPLPKQWIPRGPREATSPKPTRAPKGDGGGKRSAFFLFGVLISTGIFLGPREYSLVTHSMTLA